MQFKIKLNIHTLQIAFQPHGGIAEIQAFSMKVNPFFRET